MKKKVIVNKDVLRAALLNSLNIDFNEDRLTSLVGENRVRESENGMCEIVKLMLKEAFPPILERSETKESKVEALNNLKRAGILMFAEQSRKLDKSVMNNLESFKDDFTEEERVHIMETVGKKAFPDVESGMLPVVIILSSQILLDQVYS